MKSRPVAHSIAIWMLCWKFLTCLSLLRADSFLPLKPWVVGGPYGFFALIVPDKEAKQALLRVYQIKDDASLVTLWECNGPLYWEYELSPKGDVVVATKGGGYGERPGPEDEGMGIFRQGKTVATYKVYDLLKHKHAITHTASSYGWLESTSLDMHKQEFFLSTTDGRYLTFDITSGKLKAEKVVKKPPPPPKEKVKKPDPCRGVLDLLTPPKD